MRVDKNWHPVVWSLYRYHCRHIKRGVATTYYHNPDSNNKKGSKCGPQRPNPNLNLKVAIRLKKRRIAALGLELGFLGWASP